MPCNPVAGDQLDGTSILTPPSIAWTGTSTATYDGKFLLTTPEQYYKLRLSLQTTDKADGAPVARDPSCDAAADAPGTDCSGVVDVGTSAACQMVTGCAYTPASPRTALIGGGERCLYGGTVVGAQPYLYGYTPADPSARPPGPMRDVFGGPAGTFKIFIQACHYIT